MSKTVKKPSTSEGTKNGSGEHEVKQIRNKAVSKFLHIIAMLVLLPEGQIRSGKSGSIVWNKNGVVKKFRKPSVVRNTYTSLVRGTFQTLSSAFRTLTADVIAAWNAFTLPSKNRIGNTTTRSGKRAYISLNTNLQLTGQTLVGTPPVLTGSEAVELITLIASGIANTMSLVYTPVSSGLAMIYATAGQSAGISKPSKSKFRLIGVVDMTVASPVSLTSAYLAKFGAVNTGENYFIQVRNIAPTGERSAITAISTTGL